eukprot:s5635_g12.t1
MVVTKAPVVNGGSPVVRALGVSFRPSWATARPCKSPATAGPRGRYPLIANFDSRGSTVTSIDGRVSTLESDVASIDGRVTTLENSGGIAPTADLTVNSLTATSFAPELGGGPAGPKRLGDDPQGGRRLAGFLRGRRKLAGTGTSRRDAKPNKGGQGTTDRVKRICGYR